MIREIRETDKQRVLEICSQIWEGDDYIPLVFDDWLKDDGVFAGLWENDILVGFGKLTWLSPTDVWLEGLRKDEKTAAKNVGEKLSAYYFDYLKGKKVTSLRFSTYFGNLASIKLNEKLGFQKILTLSLKSREITTPTSKISDYLTNEISFEAFKHFAENSNYLNSTGFHLSQGWIVHRYSEKLLHQQYDQKNFAVWLEKDSICGCAVWSDVHYRDVFWVSLLDVTDENMFSEFLNYFFHLMAEKGKKEIEILVSNGQLLEFCRQFSFTSWDRENDFFLYEMPAEKIARITGILC